MRVFFLTQFYFDLHVPIVKELEHLGHSVFLVEDKGIPYDYKVKSVNSFKRFYYRMRRIVGRLEQSYWENKFLSDERYNLSYDIFICIDGVSFHQTLINHLRKNNPMIKSVLYLWDTNKYYDFFSITRFFDKVYTFDYEDSLSNQNIVLLSSYWYPTEKKELKYSLSIVGSDHDDRLEIVSKVYGQVKEASLPSKLCVLIKEPAPVTGWRSFLKYYKKIYEYSYERYLMIKDAPYTTEQKLSVDAILDLIDESVCILDTDMPIQTGATQRVIWALARGKKILSTNLSLKKMPFYNPNQIRFLDRENPVIDLAFLKDSATFPISNIIEELRIDKWVRTLISFEQ